MYANLKPEGLRAYPPEATQLVIAHLPTLQQLPLSFLPSLLRELIEYDYKFPAERAAIEGELSTLAALAPDQLALWMRPFAELKLSAALEQSDWVNQPAFFTDQLSAYLWSTHQLDNFRIAANEYAARLRSAIPAEAPPVRRLGIAVIGQGVTSYQSPLFRKLREHGTYFSNLVPDDGLSSLLAAVADRARTHPVPYGHWYVDGGAAFRHDPLLTSVSYQALGPARDALLKNIQHEVSKPGMGPEQLHSHLSQLVPADLGLHQDDRLDRFQVKLLTEGSGTQIFSTTFAQWTSREVLRRAQAVTLLVRFAPRQRQRPMNELLASGNANPELDPLGSLVDADMGAYYQCINQQRLAGADKSSFVAWFEGHSQGLAIGPAMPRGVESKSAIHLGDLISMAT
jgi:hypothetical protein